MAGSCGHCGCSGECRVAWGPQPGPCAQRDRFAAVRIPVTSARAVKLCEASPGRKGGFIQNLTADAKVWLAFRPGLNAAADATAILVAQGDAVHFHQAGPPGYVYRGEVWAIADSAAAVLGVHEEG